MKKSIVVITIAFFAAGAFGTISPSWGEDPGAAGFSCVSPQIFNSDTGAAGFSFGPPTTSFLPHLSLSPALGNDTGAAGFSFRQPATSALSHLPLRSTQTPILGYPAGAFGVGSISSGMVYQGVGPAERVRYEQHSSATGVFSFTASYEYESRFPSSGMADLFSGFLFFP
jgi:hypothetical protein